MGLRTDLYLSRKPLAGFLAIGAAWATYFAQMPVVKANVGASDGLYGMAIFASSFFSLLAMWLAPLFKYRFGGSAMALGVLIVALGMFSAGNAGGVAMMIFGMSLAAMGSGVVDVLVNARVSEIEARSGRTLMNLNHALFSFAYAGAALATGALREAAFGPLPIFALLLVLMIALAWAARDRAPELEEGTGVELHAGQMPHTVVILVGLVVLAAFLAESATEAWSALHLERTLGGTPGEGALGPALMGLTMGIGRLSGHALAQLMRDTTLMLVATLVSACGLALAALAGSVPVALAGFALAGLGISVVAPLALALVGRIVPPDQRLAAISRASVLGYGAFFLGPPLMGLVSQGFGLRVAFLVVAVFLAVVAVVLIPALAARATISSKKPVRDL